MRRLLIGAALLALAATGACKKKAEAADCEKAMGHVAELSGGTIDPTKKQAMVDGCKKYPQTEIQCIADAKTMDEARACHK